MTQVVTLTGLFPPARFDLVPWTQAQIEEADTALGTWTLIDTLALSPLDADPAVPIERNLTTALGTDADLWYRATYLDGSAGTSLPSLAIHNTDTLTVPYATAAELAGILKVNATSNAAALERVLLTAAGEIDAELGRVSTLAPWQVALAAEVNIERAVEHWQQMKSPFGIIGLGAELATHTATDSWNRHANKLAAAKETWGIA